MEIALQFDFSYKAFMARRNHHVHLKRDISDQRRLRALYERIERVFDTPTVAGEFDHSSMFAIRLPSDAAVSLNLIAAVTRLNALQNNFSIKRIHGRFEPSFQRKLMFCVGYFEFRRGG